MIDLILLGILGSSIPAVSGWFWGIYIFGWVLEIIEIICLAILLNLSMKIDKK